LPSFFAPAGAAGVAGAQAASSAAAAAASTNLFGFMLLILFLID
jgi:hypothetical protein